VVETQDYCPNSCVIVSVDVVEMLWTRPCHRPREAGLWCSKCSTEKWHSFVSSSYGGAQVHISHIRTPRENNRRLPILRYMASSFAHNLRRHVKRSSNIHDSCFSFALKEQNDTDEIRIAMSNLDVPVALHWTASNEAKGNCHSP
jgi:hypothetical protein